MNVYFATMTGNAESLASDLVKKGKEAGLLLKLLDLGDASPDELAATQQAVFIVSTWGEGEPPDDADDFWEELESSSVDLNRLSYSVFGLGDSSYSIFNGFARDLDTRLQALGASPVIERVEADVDYDDDFDAWVASVFEKLKNDQWGEVSLEQV